MSEPFREHEFLAWLRRQSQSRPVALGLGDDAALVERGGAGLLLAMDTVAVGTHVEEGDEAAEHLARKALRSNLSDIAAMGGRAEVALSSLELPRDADAALARRVMRALLDDCDRFAVVLVGGDTIVRDGPLSLCVTITGRPSERVLRRSGARSGDRLFVTGTLGGSILGKHQDFEPRLLEGAWLAAVEGVTAMTDVSDGLLRDLGNIAEASRCGAIVDVELLPVAEDARRLARLTGRSPWDHALSDGEDFELLFCVDQGRAAELVASWPFATRLSRIGEMTGSDLMLRRNGRTEVVQPLGFDHGVSKEPRR